jgi:hypothetical protein
MQFIMLQFQALSSRRFSSGLGGVNLHHLTSVRNMLTGGTRAVVVPANLPVMPSFRGLHSSRSGSAQALSVGWVVR